MELRAVEINRFFDEFDSIHRDRHQYSLEWAFEDAQRRIDSFKTDIMDHKLRQKCASCIGNQGVQNSFAGLQKTSRGIMRKTKWYTRLFANMYFLMTFVEMAISILLVLGLSEVSHSGDALIESKWFSFWFVMTFAFLKVFIERSFIKPRIEEWGWKLYSSSAERLRDMTLSLNQQATQNRFQAVPANTEEVFESFMNRWDIAEA